ncbi:hypothetical protein AAER56_13370, partial [Acinetobacter baumannii]|uniref:hypothetical protein n=1 Tax=Acinetobacter baumannii TaxID=470 RepID=UPI0031F3B07F
CLLSGEEAGENGQSESRNSALEESLPQGTRLDAPSASGSRTQGKIPRGCFLRAGEGGEAAHRRQAGKAEGFYRLYRFEDF